ncbi:TonB-dependent receptor [Gracilimonas mengyeensis]|uniref:TonB-dependent receptor n=1 Tax=Gracilimonas mengyeensis TaxID=1302730 RepID=A0A521AHF2_9BACT|nr:TonB-dependent receptor [Gracilimonas mengyeensis]SMO34168.1 TonB-dependent receptor [Gracilimonas mengyeensis]
MRKLSTIFLTLTFLFMYQANVHAQGTGNIEGVITEAGTDEPLFGANVIIAGTSKGAATDIEGAFLIRNVEAGTQTLRITYLGYRTIEETVEVEAGETIEVNFRLEWAGVEGDEINITAQAQGQISAINEQLASNTISNIVSSDRIQELPDVNAAESIGRLPGISIQRSGGEATRVAIRGLAPKFSTVSVNGVRVPSTGADDRSVDLSLISSNMLDGIEVKKAITPDMDADAIAGSIDLKLKDAPKGLKFDVQAQGGYAQLQDYYGNYKVNATASNRFLDNKLGVIATFNTDEYDRSADKFSANYGRSSDPQTGETTVLIESITLNEDNVTRGRTGASLLLDYVLPKGQLKGNMFFTRLQGDVLNRNNEIYNGYDNRHRYNLNLTDYTTSIMTSQLAIDQDYGWASFDAGVSYSTSRSENPRDYSFQFVQESNVIMSEDTDTTQAFSRYPGMHPSEVIPFITPDDEETRLANVIINDITRDEENYSVQFNGKIPFDFGEFFNGHIKTGFKFQWLDRVNDENSIGKTNFQYGGYSGSSSNAEYLRCAMENVGGTLNGYAIDELVIDNYGWIPMTFLMNDYSRDDFLSGFKGDWPIGYTMDPDAMVTFANAIESCENSSGERAIKERVAESRANDYKGEERYSAGYVMSEINLGEYVTLIPGVRFVNDYSRYEAEQFREVNVNNTQRPPTELDTLDRVRDFNFALPMVHLQIDPVDWLKIRLARTETLARPDYTQYIPRTNINYQGDQIQAGNSTLKPSTSVNYDASVSVYENKIGLFTASVFHKRIEDLVRWTRLYSVTLDEIPEGLNIPDGWLTENPKIDTFINSPNDATYRGIELDWQTNFWYLPSFLKGLVLNVNYTRIFSNTDYEWKFRTEECIRNCGTPRPIYTSVFKDTLRTDARMLDQPAHIANVTIGYDYKGFSTRLSYLYQTDRLTGVNESSPILDTFSGEYQRYDLQIKQRFTSYLEAFANFSNLTNRPDRNFQGGEGNSEALGSGSPTYIEYYGFTMDVGVRLRF